MPSAFIADGILFSIQSSITHKMLLLERKYYKNNLKLALPIIIANIGQATVAIIDNIMVGQLGATELAAAALASVIITNVMVIGMGIAMSLTPLTGELYATKDYRKAAGLFQNSLILNSLIGALISLILYFSTPILSMIGQPDNVIAMCENYFKIVAISIFPFMIFLSFKQFMEGIGNTKISMTITIVSNLMNIVLNYVLIYGKFGAPAMGIDGAAVATLISRIFMPIAFFVYLNSHNSMHRYFNFFSGKNMRLQSHKLLLTVGLPISAQMGMEIFALSSTAIMMGWLSTEALAANQILLSVMSLMFMVICGISGAVTILVSHEYGKADTTSIRRYTKAGVQMSTVFMACAAICFIFFGEYIAMAYTSDAAVIEIAGKIFLIAALFEVSDGYQVTVLGALRGIKDVRRPMLYAFISYILINIPAAYILGFVFNLGGMGIWCGFFLGLTTAGILLTIRFLKKTKMAKC